MNNKISIKVPTKKEYTQILRLTIAGATNLAGFALDVVDDSRVIVSEIMNAAIESKEAFFETFVTIEEKRVTLEFSSESGKNMLKDANEMTVAIIEALSKSVNDEAGIVKIVIEQEDKYDR